ncbi:VOC family protein [Saccharothrix coeruleofusca]|nr:VOC family protein [Saccharothrix coeruleofusca]MBP2334158.1 catechol 2,3-dioxygenase-like lactoylglutathione lyase family enzyme [Saccharothrix coeruleofusca]
MGLDQVVVDCSDAAALARFWAALLGAEPVDRPSGWSHVEAEGWPRVAFQPVPEGKSVKNRLHFDVEVDDIGAATRRALELGAVKRGEVQSDAEGRFQVMLDPEGNEFCFVSD